jgi:hypothetical protein
MSMTNKPLIPGGYYIKARCIQDSDIAHMPPVYREVWDWLLKECNHQGKKHKGLWIERGQCLRSIADIREGLSWFSGWRKELYSIDQIKKVTAWLRSHLMATTRKARKGMLITICKYDIYQNPRNYESTMGSTTVSTTPAPPFKQELKEKRKNISPSPSSKKQVYKPSEKEKQILEAFFILIHRKFPKAKLTIDGQAKGLKKVLHGCVEGNIEGLRLIHLFLYENPDHFWAMQMQSFNWLGKPNGEGTIHHYDQVLAEAEEWKRKNEDDYDEH